MSKRYRVLGRFVWWLIGLIAFDLLCTAANIMNGAYAVAIFMTVCTLILGCVLHSEVRWRTARKALMEKGERYAGTGDD